MALKAKEALTGYLEPELMEEDGSIDYKKLAQVFTLKIIDISKAIQKTPRALEKNHRTKDIQHNLRKIFYIWVLLRDMLGSKREILPWLKSPNPDFDGAAPIEMICEGKADVIIDYLTNIKSGQLS